ncbi:MAG: hypothetical protein ACRDX8_14370, partial [Acidimicrobiales bacterium]
PLRHNGSAPPPTVDVRLHTPGLAPTLAPCESTLSLGRCEARTAEGEGPILRLEIPPIAFLNVPSQARAQCSRVVVVRDVDWTHGARHMWDNHHVGVIEAKEAVGDVDAVWFDRIRPAGLGEASGSSATAIPVRPS